MQNTISVQGIKLPMGVFFSKNCSTCICYEPHKCDSQGRGYCPKRGHYYFASEREGCLDWESKD